MRERRVLPGDPVHRPAELRAPDDQQRRLLRSPCEKLFGVDGADRAASTCASIACEISRMSRPLHLPRRVRARARARSRRSSTACEAREHVWDLHDAMCGARVTTQLRAHRRPVRATCRPGFAELCPRQARQARARRSSRRRPAAHAEPDLPRAHGGHRRAARGRADRLRRDRPAAARRRRALRRAPRASRTSSTTSSTSTFRSATTGDNMDRYPGARRGAAAERAHHRAVPRAAARRPGRHRRSALPLAGQGQASSTGWRS